MKCHITSLSVFTDLVRKLVDFTLLLSSNKGAKMHWNSENVGEKWRIKSIKIESEWEVRNTHIKIERREGKE